MKTKQKKTRNPRTLIKSETLSEPGARVVETEFTLAREVLRQLRVHHSLPAAEVLAARSSAPDPVRA